MPKMHKEAVKEPELKLFDALQNGRPVSAHFFGEQLVIEPGGVVVDAARLIVSVGGIGRPSLFLNWLDVDGRPAALQLDDPAHIAHIDILLASAPQRLQPQLAQWRRRDDNRRQVGVWLGGMALAVVLFAALLWWQTPRAVGWLASQVPLAAEVQLGKLALAQLRLQGGLLENGARQQKVQQIGQQLTRGQGPEQGSGQGPGSRYNYRWLVKQDDTVNAFAMPGGIIVVHAGLLDKASNPTELAAVLAHEIQHVEQRHSLRQMISSLGWGALLALTLGDTSSLAALVAHQAGTTYFSRDMESEADRLGFQALLRAGIAPSGMLSFFDRLEHGDKADGGGAMPTWMASHPQTAERSAAIRALIASQPCPACQPLDATGWSAIQNSEQEGEQNKQQGGK